MIQEKKISLESKAEIANSTHLPWLANSLLLLCDSPRSLHGPLPGLSCLNPSAYLEEWPSFELLRGKGASEPKLRPMSHFPKQPALGATEDIKDCEKGASNQTLPSTQPAASCSLHLLLSPSVHTQCSSGFCLSAVPVLFSPGCLGRERDPRGRTHAGTITAHTD